MKKNNESFLSLSDWIDVRNMRQINTHYQLMSTLNQAAKDQRISIFRSSTKAPIGYIAWAMVNRESLFMINKTLQMPAFPYEWNEGKLMIIFDIVFAFGWEKIAQKKLIGFLSSQRFFAFIKRGKIHAYLKKGKQHKPYHLNRE